MVADQLVAEGLVTIRQAEEFLGLKRSKIYQLMDRGEIPYVKFGSARRIPRRALVTYAAARLVTRQAENEAPGR